MRATRRPASLVARCWGLAPRGGSQEPAATGQPLTKVVPPIKASRSCSSRTILLMSCQLSIEQATSRTYQVLLEGPFELRADGVRIGNSSAGLLDHRSP